MELLHLCALLLTLTGLAQSYSKYGRTCKDIGCLSNEQCVMESDPCSYTQRQNECGSYPTCKKNQNAGAPSCRNYVCPPTKVCKMDGATPKCADDHSKVGQVGYDTSALQNPKDSNQGNIYPNLRPGETTPRPNIPYQPPAGGQGYQGGQIGSGYPGQARPNPNYPAGQPYPQQPYPGYNGYQQPAGGYNGYPQQPNGYPNNGYNNNQRYPNPPPQGGYNNNPYGQQNRYGQNSGGSGSGSGSGGGILDSLTNALKKYGTNILKDAIAKKLSGN